MSRRHWLVILGIASALASGCSSPVEKPREKAKEEEKPAEPVTGRYAFYQMYLTARNWNQDAQGLRVRSISLPQVKAEPGKSGAWEAVFVSAAKAKSRTITYSAVEGEGNLHQGVFPNIEESWSGPRAQAQPWVIPAFKIDSDAAYETALKKSAEYVSKNPGKTISFLLEQTDRHPFLTWRVIWGESVTTSNYSILVNASSGEYVETLR